MGSTEGCKQCTERAQHSEKRVRILECALQDVLDLLDSGFLVRNTDNDAQPDWAFKMLKPMAKLKAAVDALQARQDLAQVPESSIPKEAFGRPPTRVTAQDTRHIPKAVEGGYECGRCGIRLHGGPIPTPCRATRVTATSAMVEYAEAARPCKFSQTKDASNCTKEPCCMDPVTASNES